MDLFGTPHTMSSMKGRGKGGVGIAADRRISKFACRRTQKKSAESRRINICRSRRFVKNVCRSSQINFTMPQKK